MKNKFNTLRQYIYEYTQQEFGKKTIDGLFRAVLEPVISNQKSETLMFLRLFDIENKQSILKRLLFSNSKLYSFNYSLSEFNLVDLQKDKTLWNKTEFIVVLGQRYSAALIWDYSESSNQNTSDVCFLYNSKIILDIAKRILENSKEDLNDIISKYLPDRRENLLLNKSINTIAKIFDDTNQEILCQEEEKKHLISSDETLKIAEITAQKAKFTAHEIKNNLSVINLYTRILEKRFEKISVSDEINESVTNSIKNINNASENISNFISDLRCISSPHLEKVNIKEIINKVIFQCFQKAKNAGVEIIAAEAEDIILFTDKTKLECSLLNIIFNAIEACKSSGIIKIELKQDTEKVNIVISNNGEEIKEEIKEKIFEPDFTTKANGNGFGLAICKSQLNLIKGDIRLLYSSKESTAFEIILPFS